MNPASVTMNADQQIAELTARLEAAKHRADVAEEQLRRVHAAVRAFKERQLAAKHAALVAQPLTVSSHAPAQTWIPEDPTLDIRFQEFLDGEGDQDAARKWILADD